MIRPSEEDARFARGQLASGCERMERLLLGLLDSHGSIAAEVHAIRKLGKSLRGGFTLFQLKETSSREIQAIGRLLSGPRDAVSRLSTWQKLGWNADPATAEAISSLLDLHTRSAAHKPPLAAIHWCVERVKSARQHLEELPEECLLPRIIRGQKKLRKRVTRRCRHLGHGDHEDFHDARKALKACLGAFGFLPEGSTPPEREMADLAEILGDENDLATLSVWLEEHGFTLLFAADLWKQLAHTRRQLQTQAMDDAEWVILGLGLPDDPLPGEA